MKRSMTAASTNWLSKSSTLPVVAILRQGTWSIPTIPLARNVKRFRGGLVFEAHRRVYHSTLGWSAIKKKKTSRTTPP